MKSSCSWVYFSLGRGLSGPLSLTHFWYACKEKWRDNDWQEIEKQITFRLDVRMFLTFQRKVRKQKIFKHATKYILFYFVGILYDEPVQSSAELWIEKCEMYLYPVCCLIHTAFRKPQRGFVMAIFFLTIAFFLPLFLLCNLFPDLFIVFKNLHNAVCSPMYSNKPVRPIN